MTTMRAMSRKLMLGAISKEAAVRCLKERGREVAEAVAAALPESWRYVVILRDDDTIAFFSASDREAVIDMLEKVLAQLKLAASSPRGSPSPQR